MEGGKIKKRIPLIKNIKEIIKAILANHLPSRLYFFIVLNENRARIIEVKDRGIEKKETTKNERSRLKRIKGKVKLLCEKLKLEIKNVTQKPINPIMRIIARIKLATANLLLVIIVR